MRARIDITPNRFRDVRTEESLLGRAFCRLGLHRWSYVNKGRAQIYCTRFRCKKYRYRPHLALALWLGLVEAVHWYRAARKP